MKLVLAVLLGVVTLGGGPKRAGAAPSSRVVQPSRSAKDAARFAAIDDALATAITRAASAKMVADACSLADLGTKLYELDKVTPPRGTDAEFEGQRNAVYMRFQDLKSVMCVHDEWKLDDIRRGLATLRRVFVGFEGIGAP